MVQILKTKNMKRVDNLKDLKFLGVSIAFRTTHELKDLMGTINIGGITLRKGNRDYILDPVETFFTHPKGGGTLVECKLDSFENVEKDFMDCGFELTKEDLLSRKLDTAEMFIDFEDHAKEDYGSDISSITLAFKSGEMTIVIDLDSEMFDLVD